jgi:hypothetical protein
MAQACGVGGEGGGCQQPKSTNASAQVPGADRRRSRPGSAPPLHFPTRALLHPRTRPPPQLSSIFTRYNLLATMI